MIIKCYACWAHYEHGNLHICDPLMKKLVDEHNKKDEVKETSQQQGIPAEKDQVIHLENKEAGAEVKDQVHTDVKPFRVKSIERDVPLKGDYIVFYQGGKIYEQGNFMSWDEKAGIMELRDCLVDMRTWGLTYDILGTA